MKTSRGSTNHISVQLKRSQSSSIAKAIVLLSISAACLQTQSIRGQPITTGVSSDSTTLVDIGPHSRTYSIGGRPTLALATGMNYWDGKSWSPSDPSFLETPNGFVAGRVQHRTRLSSDLNVAGAVAVTTPDGLALSSTPVAIGIYDAVSGEFALVGYVTNCLGELASNNQILFENAFLGTCASVVYTLGRGSFEQDIVFTGRLDPADYGFVVNDKSHLRIQILTELYQPPEPDVITQPIYVESDPAVRQQMVSPDLMDETIGFGEFVLGLGRAFVTPSIAATNGAAAAVAKELIKTEDGRIMLVESVDYLPLRDALLSLPDCQPPGGTARLNIKKDRLKAYASIAVPPHAKEARTLPKPARKGVATTSRIPEGVVIDYVATISGNLNSTTLFASDTNYFISGNVFCNGAVTMEATIFKYKTNTFLQLNNTLTTKSSMYRPIVCTAEDDNTIGDSLSGFPGYTGTINTGGYANPAILMNQTSLSLTNFRFCYAQQAVRYTSPAGNTAATLNITHSQFVNCIRGVEIDFSGAGTGTGVIAVNLNNSLMAGVNYPVYASSVGNPVTCTLENCTFDRSTQLFGGSANGVTLKSTNSIYVSMTNSTTGVTFAANFNGFYNDVQSFGGSQVIAPSFPFQTVGAGSYYLVADSNFRNAGTSAGIPSALLTDLQKRTTYPPLVTAAAILNSPQSYFPQVQRDTDTLDLGFHYDPLDWALGGVLVTNATVTVSGGTAIAGFATNGYSRGLSIGQGASLQSQGTPNVPNWIVQYNTVQEEPITSWFTATNGILSSEYQGVGSGSTINCRFTDFSIPSLDAPAFNAPTNTGPLNFQDCEFHSGKLLSALPTVNLTNCLLERVYTDLEPKDNLTNYFRNCLVYGASFTFFPSNSLVQDNLFDSPIITNRNGYTGGFNAYVTNLTRMLPTKSTDVILASSPSYQAGPLGAYYVLASSVLINADTNTTADQVGLYQYTVCTNIASSYEVKETNSWVDVTYHYVVTDASGNPQDTDGDGIPDYLEDPNGNGKVDSGETAWNAAADLGLKVLITRPKNNSVIP